MKFRYNAFFRILCLINGILFLGIVTPKFLGEKYFEGSMELLIGVFWLLYYLTFRRPYIEIIDRKLKVNRGLLKSVEYRLEDLEVLKNNDYSLVFRCLHMNKVKQVKIYYGYLSYMDNQKLKEVFNKFFNGKA